MIRTLGKIHGGKSYLSKFIVEQFPIKYTNMTYVEPFGGFAATLTYKDKSLTEIYNELNPEIYWSFVALRLYPKQLHDSLLKVSFNKDNFDKAKVGGLAQGNSVILKRAVNEIVRRRFSRGGMGKDFGWSDRLRRGKPEYISSWETFLNDIFPLLVKRFADVIMTNQDGISLIDKYSHKDVLLYADPPYLAVTRTHKTTYGQYEITRDQHENLAYYCNQSKAKILISCYRSKEYDSWYKNWNKYEKVVANSSGQNKVKQKRTECLLTNF